MAPRNTTTTSITISKMVSLKENKIRGKLNRIITPIKIQSLFLKCITINGCQVEIINAFVDHGIYENNINS